MTSTVDWLWNRRQAVWGRVEVLETPGNCVITNAMSREIDRADCLDIAIIDCPAETLADVLTKAREATAYHEAGHAVIARVLGLTCGQVSIIADDDSAGRAIIADPWQTAGDWENRDRFRDARQAFRGTIIARMAGAEAEREFFGQCRGRDDNDRYDIALLMDSRWTEIPADDWDQYEARLRAQTRRLVRRHRDTIERVAAALMKHKTLPGDEVHKIVEGSHRQTARHGPASPAPAGLFFCPQPRSHRGMGCSVENVIRQALEDAQATGRDYLSQTEIAVRAVLRARPDMTPSDALAAVNLARRS